MYLDAGGIFSRRIKTRKKKLKPILNPGSVMRILEIYFGKTQRGFLSFKVLESRLPWMRMNTYMRQN